MRKSVLVALMALLFGAANAAADVYTWRDAEGMVHFGDKAPDGVVATRVHVASKRTDRAAVKARYESRQKSLTASNEEYRTNSSDRKAAEAAENLSKEEAAAACTSARERLKDYINARRLFRRDENGEPVYLDASEIDQARAEAEAAVAEKCR